MTHQPPDADPSNWKPRTDAGARKLIDRIDAMTEKLDARIRATDEDVLQLSKAVNRRFKGKVSYAWLITILGGASLAVVGFSVNAANQTRKEMVEAREQLASDVRQVRTETAGKLQSIDAKVDGLWKLLVEGKSKPAVREEFKQRSTEEK